MGGSIWGELQCPCVAPSLFIFSPGCSLPGSEAQDNTTYARAARFRRVGFQGQRRTDILESDRPTRRNILQQKTNCWKKREQRSRERETRRPRWLVPLLTACHRPRREATLPSPSGSSTKPEVSSTRKTTLVLLLPFPLLRSAADHLSRRLQRASPPASSSLTPPRANQPSLTLVRKTDLTSNEYLVLASTFHSIHAIASRISPVPGSSGVEVVEAETFKMTCFQSPTGALSPS